MISQLQGLLIEKTPSMVVVDVHGVGYELSVSMRTYDALPAIQQPITIFTQLVVREDIHSLFGFMDKEERATFRLLTKISGIGTKTALGILSTLTPQELSLAVATEDLKTLATAPGIGKKTAERMMLELRGKISNGASLVSVHANQEESSMKGDVLGALMALGYTEREALLACKQIPTHLPVDEAVRLALKNTLK